MQIDPQAKRFLEQMKTQGGPPRSELTLEEIRANKVKLTPLAGVPEEVARVKERTVPVQGAEIKVRIYTPEGNGPFPVFVYFHGGGFVFGDLSTVDTPLRAVTNAAGCIVLSVDYRRAPEHKFPAAPEDCYAATKWAAENAASFNGDPARMAVGGDSAGGNLAAVVSLMSRDRGGPSLVYQILIYPCTNWSFDTRSHRDNEQGYMLERQNVEWSCGHYLRDHDDSLHPYAAPLLAGDLSELPPALVITAEFDPLRDEGEAYGAQLNEAGVQVDCTRYDGMIHSFFTLAGIIDKGKEAIDQVGRALQAAFRYKGNK